MKISAFSSIMVVVAWGILFSGCIHRNQQAWSDQRENGSTSLIQPSASPIPTATPTPTLQEFVEQKMAGLDEIDEELDEIDQILRPHLDETK